MDSASHTVITISRQIGSGGTYIGYLLAKELGFKYVDREVLRKAAEHLKTDERWLEQYDERSSGLIESVLKVFSLGQPETTYMPTVKLPVYDSDLFRLECRIMKDIARRYDAVIVGRGAFHALKDHPGQVRLFIHAPIDFRIQRLMKVQGISDAGEARKIVEESDMRRTKFVRDMIGVDWTDARNFHLCLDASLVGFPASVELIRSLVPVKTKRSMNS
ncbi:MAG TPA: cytidylate kinase-like family protein [Deltaproteobacteria bacterium]|jgi:cytidylate kinase|nr:cytidylate kinase-like family protein [Deltaproteobacteria bacterium]HQI01936.1 cytidylate kinase-like family protein [Deltaproteobacteria bacterium]HQJ08890.1 cytidylate kinase-like family protein [Deltaproteobacteria bacterium]